MWKLAAALAVAMSLALSASAQATVTTYDSFTEFADGVLLENHTGETGASWSRHPSFAATPLTINNERVWGSQGGLYVASGIPSNAEYSVIGRYEVLTNSGSTALVGRVSMTSQDYYRGGYNAATGKWELVKCVAATCTVLADSAAVIPEGTTYPIQLQLLNSRKSLIVDGATVATSTDNSITSAGRAGIRTGPGVVTSTTGYQIDEFEVYSEADTTITGGPSGATNSTTAMFSFTSTPTGGTFECDFDAFPEDNFAPCPSTGISYPGLADGTHTFRVRSTVAGTTDTTPATRTFTVDTVAPNTTITSGPSGATNNASPTFAFTSSEGSPTFECRLDGPGGTGVYAACTSPKQYNTLAQGSYTLNVRAKDAAGNQDASAATRAFTVDTTAPNTTINSGPSDTIGSSSASFGFGSPDGGITYQCRLDGPGGTGVYAACTSPKPYTSLAEGSYTFNVRATDAAGNQDASAATQAFTVSVGTVVWKADAELPLDQEWASACIEDGNPFGWRTNDPALLTDASPNVDAFATRDGGISPPPAQGLKSWRLTVHDGDFCGDAGGTSTSRVDQTCTYRIDSDSCDSERAELGMENPGRTDMTNRLFNVNEDRWISWQLYLPSTFPVNPSSWQSILQWKQVGGLGTPVLNMAAENGQFQLLSGDSNGNTNGQGITRWSATAVTQRWVKFTLHVKFSPDANVGFVELFSDIAAPGNVVRVMQKTMTYTMKLNGTTVVPSHARIGVYRDRPINGTVSAYYDGYTVATGRGAAEGNAFGP